MPNTKTETETPTETLWQVTRTCCISGQCIDCHTSGQRRQRIVHAANVSKKTALEMVAGWKAYDAKASEMP